MKNSYADIEEIKLTSPVYFDVPGNWTCAVHLSFSNGEKVTYRMGHDLDESPDYSATTTEDILELLRAHHGITKHKVKVTYSNKEVREE